MDLSITELLYRYNAFFPIPFWPIQKSNHMHLIHINQNWYPVGLLIATNVRDLINAILVAGKFSRHFLGIIIACFQTGELPRCGACWDTSCAGRSAPLQLWLWLLNRIAIQWPMYPMMSVGAAWTKNYIPLLGWQRETPSPSGTKFTKPYPEIGQNGTLAVLAYVYSHQWEYPPPLEWCTVIKKKTLHTKERWTLTHSIQFGKKIIFCNLIEDYSINSHCKIKFSSEYR